MKFSQLNNNKDFLGQFGIDMEKSKQGEGSRGGKIIGHTKSGKAVYENSKEAGVDHYTKQDHKDAAELHEEKGRKISLEGKRKGRDREVNNHYTQSSFHTKASKTFNGDKGQKEDSIEAHKKRGFNEDTGDEDITKSDIKKKKPKKDEEQSYKYNSGTIQHTIQTVVSSLLPAKQKGFQLPVGKWNKEGDQIDYMIQVAFDASQPRPAFHKMKKMIADELGIEGSKVVVQSLGKEDIEPEKELKEGEKKESQWRAHIIITIPKQQMDQLSLRDHFDDNEEQEMKTRAREKQMGKMKKSDELVLDIDLDVIEQELMKAEGDKGGIIIGRTDSGKPIYKNKKASEYKKFSKKDHADAADIHRNRMMAQRRTHKDYDHHSKMAGEHYDKAGIGEDDD